MTTVFLYFVFYSFLGWACESLYKSIPKHKLINSGFLHGPYCPVYGVGALLILYVLLPFHNNVFLVFILGMIVTSLLEYFTSWLLEVIFHMSWWDYSKHRFNIHGRVCLLNSTLFACMSVVVVYVIHPFATSLFDLLNPTTQTIVALVVATILLIDVITTTIAIINMNKAISKVHEYLHAVYENAIELKDRLEDEAVVQKLIKKREHLLKSFPNLKHMRFDITSKSLNEILIKRKNKKGLPK